MIYLVFTMINRDHWIKFTTLDSLPQYALSSIILIPRLCLIYSSSATVSVDMVLWTSDNLPWQTNRKGQGESKRRRERKNKMSVQESGRSRKQNWDLSLNVRRWITKPVFPKTYNSISFRNTLLATNKYKSKQTSKALNCHSVLHKGTLDYVTRDIVFSVWRQVILKNRKEK